MTNRTSKVGLVTVLATLALGSSADPAAAITRSNSGKTLAYYTSNPTGVQAGTFTATILKGKKKQSLIIEVSASVIGGATFLCLDDVRVNGLLAHPSTGGFNVVCTPISAASSQTISAVYVFDIDDGELVFPGTFVGQPLNVVVKTNTDIVGGTTGGVSVVVRMEKK